MTEETDQLDTKLGPIGRAILMTAIRKALTVGGVAGSVTVAGHAYVALSAGVALAGIVWSFWKEIRAARQQPK